MSESNLLLVLTLAFMYGFVNSMRFEILSGHTKCISEDIKNNALAVGMYNVVNPNEGFPIPDAHKLNVRVSQWVNHQTLVGLMVYEYIISCKFRIRDQLFISFIIYFLFLIIGLNLFHPKIIIIITKTIIYLCFCWRNGAVLCSHGLFEGLT